MEQRELKAANVLAILAALGGIAVFLGGVWAIVRGIIRQTDATKDNTDAINRLTARMDKMAGQVNSNSERIARLEGRRRG